MAYKRELLHSKDVSNWIYKDLFVGANWPLLVRLCFVGGSILLAASHVFTGVGGSSEYQRVSLFILGGLFCGSFLGFLVSRDKNPSRALSITHLIVDVVIVTGAVYVTGGPVSPFVSLYLPLVMLASVVSSRRRALFLGAVASLAYITLAYLLHEGILPPSDGIIPISEPVGGLLLQTIGLTSGMILMSVATSFLVRRVQSSEYLAEQSRKDLEALNLRQQHLINEIPDGIITTQLDAAVMSLNQAASDLLKISSTDSIGKSIENILKPKYHTFRMLRDVSEKGVEIPLSPSDSAEKQHLSCIERPLYNAQGNHTGWMFIFRDVTKLRTIEEQLEMQERMARLVSDPDFDQGTFQTRVREFVGQSAIMQQVFKLIARVAPSDATTLICGESGTGKELVAKAIHLGGHRAVQPFITVNCGAIPEALLESELFGHKKGSFTGAIGDHPGMFLEADGGTLFLDEIGELPLHMQAKLLRALQDKSVRPVGGTKDVPIDVRIIAATNRNLKREVEKGTFREDLYFRLNVIMVQLPALRDRKEDLPYLINSILKAHVKNRALPLVPPATMQYLLEYNYPGNVRELENLLERALVLGGDAILPEHLPDTVLEYKKNQPTQSETKIVESEEVQFPVDLDSILQNVEKKYLEVALRKTNGVKKRAAELLGINFRSFRYRLEKLGMSGEDE